MPDFDDDVESIDLIDDFHCHRRDRRPERAVLRLSPLQYAIDWGSRPLYPCRDALGSGAERYNRQHQERRPQWDEILESVVEIVDGCAVHIPKPYYDAEWRRVVHASVSGFSACVSPNLQGYLHPPTQAKDRNNLQQTQNRVA